LGLTATNENITKSGLIFRVITVAHGHDAEIEKPDLVASNDVKLSQGSLPVWFFQNLLD
jgi:hypothetical protein